jgi:hypothetical protein
MLIPVSYKEEICEPLITTNILSLVWSQFTTNSDTSANEGNSFRNHIR